MIIERYVSELMFSNMYVLKEAGHALIIDPHDRFEMVENTVPDLILLTHEHYDHISGVNLWKERFHIPLLCSEECAHSIANARKNMARYFEAFSQMQTYGEQDPNVYVDENYTCHAEITFSEELKFKWQGNTVFLFELPGHSRGSTGILVNETSLFSGDSLFADRETELRFPGGSKREWESVSLPVIRSISGDVDVYPGHRDKFKMKDGYYYGVV